jgi:hypothetical protein
MQVELPPLRHDFSGRDGFGINAVDAAHRKSILVVRL